MNHGMGLEKTIDDSERDTRTPRRAAQPGSPPHAAAIPHRTYTTGITVAMAGVLTFFIALVSAYIVRQGSAAEDWRSLSIPNVVWFNTAILVATSVTLARSRRHFLSADQSGLRHWSTVTAILGLFFMAGQMMAWRQLSAAGVHLSTNPSSSFFYLLTAAHALYLLGGIAALLIVGFRSPTPHALRAASVRVVSIYWNSMVGIWACLFLLFILRP